MSAVKKTPLADRHAELGGKMVDFAGWWMPVQYKGLKEEHLHTRQAVGLFDVSHMGEVRVRGPQSLAALQWLTTNDVSKLENGQAHYSLLLNADGGIVDDIIVYCLKKSEDYLVCVNASNKDKDFQWMLKNNQGALITDESDQWGQIAVQGPKAIALLQKIFGQSQDFETAFRIYPTTWNQSQIFIATTGYTGEKGAEIFVPAAQTVALWNLLLEAGQEFQAEPIGLGARDTLRTEMKYSLYGHEIDDQTHPYQAGLGWVVKPSAKDFMGKQAALQRKETCQTKLVGFRLTDKGIPRQGYDVVSADGAKIGYVTSGTLSPSLGESIGIAYVPQNLAAVGSEILIDIRGRKVSAKVVETPFVKK